MRQRIDEETETQKKILAECVYGEIFLVRIFFEW